MDVTKKYAKRLNAKNYFMSNVLIAFDDSPRSYFSSCGTSGTFASIKSLSVNPFSAILSSSGVNMHKCKTSQDKLLRN